MECKHQIDILPNSIFKCKLCSLIHKCDKDCEYLQYNTDHTQVCSISGLCYGQKLCYAYDEPNKTPYDFIHKTKKDQQRKNAQINSVIITRVLNENMFPKCPDHIVYEIERQIVSLWREYILCIKTKNIYINRKDSISFIVGILFSFRHGIKSYDSDNYIVYPHPKFITSEINKKKKYKYFNVSNITYGIKKIKKVFSSYDVVNKIKIDYFIN